jgi:hypothetical protein
VPHERKELTLADAARALGGKSWPQMYRLILRGDLEARQDARGRWWIGAASVREFQKSENGAAVARAS